MSVKDFKPANPLEWYNRLTGNELGWTASVTDAETDARTAYHEELTKLTGRWQRKEITDGEYRRLCDELSARTNQAIDAARASGEVGHKVRRS